MSEVFADAFYYIALLNPRDQFHPFALELTGRFQRQIITTTAVLIEVADALSYPRIRARSHMLLERLSKDANTTILPADEWYERGLSIFGGRADKEWSLTDCMSFSVMTERGITDALTGDHHFVQAGFQALMIR